MNDTAFQTGEADAGAAASRLALLREELARRGVDGFVVPRGDEHQGEYVPARAERLAWLTGFTGSAGTAVVLKDRAAIFIDGRYTLQAKAQVDAGLYEHHQVPEASLETWIIENLQKGAVLGYDPWLHTLDSVERLKQACQKAEAHFRATAGNPVDAIWTDQPGPPLGTVVVHDEKYAGESPDSKRTRIGEILSDRGADAAVLTMPDTIAWLLNIRGSDVAHSPLPLSFATLHRDGRVDLFIDERKMTDEVRGHLGNTVAIHPPDELGNALTALGRNHRTVLIDPSTAASWIHDRLTEAGAAILKDGDPCALPKARKNAVEIEGARQAHLRDGAALTRFIRWVKSEGPSGKIDEIMAEAKLRAFRDESGVLKDLSFDTISGSGPNGAIVHYRVTPATNRNLQAGELYLVDSGGQYLDGTTDVTRTLAIGEPTPEHKDRFTRVLKGHIALAMVRFPKGVSGAHLDVLARSALWHAGLDFDHGTGHGVGSYLCVHEGPQSISRRPNNVPLEPGMIVSNEPGFYKAGAFGIRIENLVVVTEPKEIEGGERPMLGFETLTLAPIDSDLVEPSMLTAGERDWLNNYHARVLREIGPRLDQETRLWLEAATHEI